MKQVDVGGRGNAVRMDSREAVYTRRFVRYEVSINMNSGVFWLEKTIVTICKMQ